jgi:hypothetical protein
MNFISVFFNMNIYTSARLLEGTGTSQRTLYSTVKLHFVTIKHVVMFFKLQFSHQQLVFIFKIVKTLVTILQSYPTI